MSQNSMYQESLRAFLKPVLKYLDDPDCSEIMINGPNEIWVEAKGRLILTESRFTEEGLLGAARNMAQFVGRVLNDERPRLDARLPDGSRIHVVLPPIARKGTTISIRKFMSGRPGIEELIQWGSLTPQMAWLIRAMVHTKLNIVVAGGTGSGKTTLLNIVSTQIPNEERIVTIEDSAELQMQQEHIVPFESRPADKFGKGEVNMGHLLHSALRLRPDRIVVGEVRGGEAFDLMQAMNTGHGGSMATTHANTPTDTLRRIESLCLQSGIELPMVAIRAQVAAAINAIITCERFHDGSRRTTSIAEVLPLNEKGDYRTQSLFVYAPTHRDKDGRLHGYHAPTGLIPTFLGRLQSHGFPDITEAFFDPKTYGVPPPPNIFSEALKLTWAPSLKHREQNQPDPAELKDAMARASELAEERERALQEKVAAKAFLDGYDFSSGHAAKERGAEPVHSPPPAAEAAPPGAPPPRAPPPPRPRNRPTLPSPRRHLRGPRRRRRKPPQSLTRPPSRGQPRARPDRRVQRQSLRRRPPPRSRGPVQRQPVGRPPPAPCRAPSCRPRIFRRASGRCRRAEALCLQGVVPPGMPRRNRPTAPSLAPCRTDSASRRKKGVAQK
jgi:pilus assembly protein CpaF